MFYSSVSKDNVQTVEWWKVFGLSSPHILEKNQNKACLYLPWREPESAERTDSARTVSARTVSARTDSAAASPLEESLSRESRGQVQSPSSCVLWVNQALLAFDTHCPKGWHHGGGNNTWQKDSESELYSLWDWPPGEEDWGILTPTWFGVGLMSPYTLAAVEKVKRKIYFITFLFSIKCSHTHKIHTMNMRWLFFFNFFKNKEAPIPVHLCIKSLI